MGTIINSITSLLQQNPVNIAVGVSMGASFTILLAAITQGLVIPLLSIIFGTHDFTKLKFRIRNTDINIGVVLNAFLYLILVVLVLIIFVIQPINIINKNLGIHTPFKLACPYCTTLINVDATVCSACTRSLPDNWSK